MNKIPKKAVIEKLRLLGYKSNYRNTLVSMIDKGYVLVIDKGSVLHKISVDNLK